MSRGFQWGASTEGGDQPESLSSDDDSDGDLDVSRGRKRKKKHAVQKDLTTTMHSKAPESTADFERLLLGSPNSSFLWIQYMSFQLQLSELEKAREIGRRAISAINFREEQERLNVWIARLNLENSYGTEETLEETFRLAASHHDAKHMHLRLASILEQTEKFEVSSYDRQSSMTAD
jgi:rRNA biogenesis protein RRP5